MSERRSCCGSRGARLRSFVTAAVLAGGFEAAAEAANVEGTVKTPGGAPAAGAVVSLAKAGGFPPTDVTADGSGHYLFEFVSTGCYELSAESPAYGIVLHGDTVVVEDQTRVTVGTQNLTGQDLQFLPPHALSGTVTFGGASPPAKMTVHLYDADGNPTAITGDFSPGTPGHYPYTFPAPAGDYCVAARPAGVLAFETFYDGDFTCRDGVKVTVADLDVDGIDFTVPDNPKLSVHLRDSGDSPFAGVAEVFAPGSNVELLQRFVGSSGDDTFAVPLPPGTGVIVNARPAPSAHPFANAEGTMDGWSAPVTLTGGTDVLTLHKPDDVPTLSGQITEAGTGTPIGSGTVTVTPAVPVVIPGATATQDAFVFAGNYQFNALQPGWYAVAAKGPAVPTDFHVPTRTPGLVQIAAPGVTRNLSLQLGGRIQFTAMREGGGPVSGYTIETYDATCKLVDAAPGPSTFNIPPGDYRELLRTLDPSLASFWHGGSSCATATPITVAAGQTTAVSTQFPSVPVHTVRGVAGDFQGNPLSFADVTLRRLSDGRIFTAKTDACGVYALSIPDGIYEATLVAAGFPIVTAQLTVAGGAIVNDFTAPGSTTTSVVEVRQNGTGTPVAGATVCVEAQGIAKKCADSDLNGAASIDTAGSGPKSVTVGYHVNEDARRESLQSNPAIVFVTLLAGDVLEVFDDAGGQKVASNRPAEAGAGSGRRPRASLAREFQSGDDVDWFRFDAVSGKYYRATLSGTLSEIAPINEALYVGATKAPVEGGADALFGSTGWQAPSTGEFWVALSSPFSGSYTVSLAQSDAPFVPMPAPASVTPTSGPAAGGTSVTVVGTGFVDGATVSFGGTPAGSVVFVDSGHLTCTAPARPAGTLNDVVVTNPGAAPGTLAKGWLADFSDVPQAYLYHLAVEKVFRAGITTGCAAGRYCPNDPVTRDAMAVFILRGEHGGPYSPPAATGTVFSDVTAGTFLAKWIEQFGREGITTGCGAGSPPPYCPAATVTRDGMAVFLLRGKHGAAFSPPGATGHVFGDVSTSTFLAKWMEQLKAENITSGCGGGNYCPGGTVTRGEMAKFIRTTFGL